MSILAHVIQALEQFEQEYGRKPGAVTVHPMDWSDIQVECRERCHVDLTLYVVPSGRMRIHDVPVLQNPDCAKGYVYVTPPAYPSSPASGDEAVSSSRRPT